MGHKSSRSAYFAQVEVSTINLEFPTLHIAAKREKKNND